MKLMNQNELPWSCQKKRQLLNLVSHLGLIAFHTFSVAFNASAADGILAPPNLAIQGRLISPPLPGSNLAKHSNEPNTASQTLTIQELRHALIARLPRVPEYRFINKEAERLGVRVYLFGGTAAAYAHYVRWDLLREKGDSRFQADRFDYDFTNIYRSNQDLDIVVDGSAAQIAELQKRLQEVFPHFQGSKEAWEVRSLREKVNGKIALLNNPDFLNQNTDSNSVGLIAINEPNELLAVRDLREWQKPDSHFLTDILHNQLHYYHSDLHHTTELAKAGRNPEIFSVIRYLVKVVQFELDMNPDDLRHIQQMVEQFNPEGLMGDVGYQKQWLEKNSVKLIQHAVNIEYAWNLIEKLGLRNKLIAISNDAGVVNTMAWWLSREPLRSQDVGKGKGRSPKELGIDIVAHETKSFSAYESITRAHTGEANVLVSRENVPGETAALGKGFYTRVGRTGARGTGLTIRFHLDPNAVEGVDFKYDPESGYVIVTNKSALKVIPESLNLGPLEYFQMIDSFDPNEKGIFEKLKRRLKNQFKTLSPGVLLQLDNSLIVPAKAPWESPLLVGTTLIPPSIREAITTGLIYSLPNAKKALHRRTQEEQGQLSPYFLELIQNSNQHTDVLLSDLDYFLTKSAETNPTKAVNTMSQFQIGVPGAIIDAFELGIAKKLPKLQAKLLKRAIDDLNVRTEAISCVATLVRIYNPLFSENSQKIEFNALYDEKMIGQLKSIGGDRTSFIVRSHLIEFLGSESFFHSEAAKKLYAVLFTGRSVHAGFGGLNSSYQIKDPKTLAEIAKLVPTSHIESLIGPENQNWTTLEPFSEEIRQRLFKDPEARTNWANLIRKQMKGIWKKNSFATDRRVTVAPSSIYVLSSRVLVTTDFLNQFTPREIFELFLISHSSQTPDFHRGFPFEITKVFQQEWNRRKQGLFSMETKAEIATIVSQQFEFDLGYRLSQIIDRELVDIMNPNSATMLRVLYEDINERLKSLRPEMPLTTLPGSDLELLGQLVGRVFGHLAELSEGHQKSILKRYFNAGGNAEILAPKLRKWVGSSYATRSLTSLLLRDQELFQTFSEFPNEFAELLIASVEPSTLKDDFPQNLDSPGVREVFNSLKQSFETHPNVSYRGEALTKFIDPYLKGLSPINSPTEPNTCTEKLR